MGEHVGWQFAKSNPEGQPQWPRSTSRQIALSFGTPLGPQRPDS